MKVALVYDRVNKWGGAERVLLTLHKIWPEAPLYTSVYDPKGAPWAKVFKVVPSFLQNFPFAKKAHEFYPLLMPLAFESFSSKNNLVFGGNFDKYDLVISLTSEAAKGIITKPKTLHICYCLTPTRYLWSGYQEYFRNRMFKLLTKPVIVYLRAWDKIAAQRPDCYFAISLNVQKRIKKYYGRESEVVYPPVELSKFKIKNEKTKATIKNEKFFLVVSRLVPYKRVDIAIEAFNRLGEHLKIVGTGSEMGRLRRMAERNVEFLGQLTDKELLSYYQNCQAVIFPQEEDFGLVPVEAQACGKPVIAFRGGGATETVIENKTGEFFYPQTSEALIKILKKFKTENYRKEDCRKNAEKFSEERFIKKFKKEVEKRLK